MPFLCWFNNRIDVCCLITPAGQEGSESHTEIHACESSGRDTSYKNFIITMFNVLGGLLVVFCVSSSLVGTTQLVQLTYESCPCPFFISWFSSNWNIFFFPLYYFGYMSTTQEKQSPVQKFRWVNSFDKLLLFSKHNKLYECFSFSCDLWQTWIQNSCL